VIGKLPILLLRRKPEKFIRQADASRDRKHWAAAATGYRQALDLDPGLSGIWVQYGHALKESGHPPQAEAAYRRALSIEPGNADTHLQLGHVRKIQGDIDGAAECYRDALRHDPAMADPAHELDALGLQSVSEKDLLRNKIMESVVIENFIKSGLMPDPTNMTVWDLGTGNGYFAMAMANMGAKRVLASDVQELGVKHDRVAFVKGEFADAVAAFGENGRIEADLVFMHLMTEHVVEIRSFLHELYEITGDRTQIFVHHDNFFQPVGHHDHDMLFLDNATWEIKPQGTSCWAHESRCALSDEHRSRLSEGRWSAVSEASRDPSHCGDCNYFRRSQPWAHLIYADKFAETFPETVFHEAMNAVSARQLRLYAIMAGWEILAEERSWIANKPSDDLVAAYSIENLSTFTYSFRARKRAR